LIQTEELRMTAKPLTQLPPTNGSPIDPVIWPQLKQHINTLSSEQRWWLSGYLAALGNQQTEPTQVAVGSTTKPVLTIVYGSQTGNGQAIAEQLNQQATAQGLQTALYSLADFTTKQLAKTQWLSLVISTHGEGEAPDDAELFYEQLFSQRTPQLPDLSFNVLALGDSSYELFCQTGKEIDQRLSELGAKRLAERLDCDVDYEAIAEQWIDSTLEQVKPLLAETGNITSLPGLTHAPTVTDRPTASKANPVTAKVLAIQKINGQGSVKNTYHLELAIDPQVIQYQPGDSLGIHSENDPQLVSELLSVLGLSGDETFSFKNQQASLHELLLKHIEITQVSKPLLQWLAERTTDQSLQEAAHDHQAFTAYVARRQLLDVLREHQQILPADLNEWLSQLRGLTPRLYSIASAQLAFEDEVHLTVNLDDPSLGGYHGLASGLLCDRLTAGDEIQVYVEPNKHFKLPEDSATDVIMIGPGTGVAPYRAFIQHRASARHTGRNWLFFGNPNFATDFLYQTEWLKWHKQGVLTDINLAFSRDQEDKHYVQHEVLRAAEQLWQWISEGASLYLCGDANRMAPDVEQALVRVFTEQGKLDDVAAKQYLTQLKRDKRYQKDVY
jgi:sulfite reductase (NADPH) flavoprotein alpha-component